MANIWFTSDWHLGHRNIVRGLSNWGNLNACRDFNTLEEHDETLINNVNRCVDKDDILYMLGDFSLGGRQGIYDYRRRIDCNTIHLILGNHDIHIRKNTELIDVSGIPLRARDLFTSISERLCRDMRGESFVLDHYSLRTWPNGHHGAIMLYGHSHGSLPEYTISLPTTVKSKSGSFIKTTHSLVKFKTMDVGVDTHPEFRPYHIEEIQKEMMNRIPLMVDHHLQNKEHENR